MCKKVILMGLLGGLLGSVAWGATIPTTITWDEGTRTYTGSGTITGSASDPLAVSGETTFYCTGQVNINSPVTGTGTLIHNANGSHKLTLYGDLSQFTGTVQNDYNRWIEVTAGPITNMTNSTGIGDASGVRFHSNTTGQGFAFWADSSDRGTTFLTQTGDDYRTFRLGALTGTGQVISSAFSKTNLKLQIGNDSTTPSSADNVFSGSINEEKGQGDYSSYTAKIQIEKVGSSTWTLTGSNKNWTGGTIVSGGTLVVSGTSLPAAGGIQVNSQGTLSYQYNGNTAWNIADNTTLTVAKGGTLFLDTVGDKLVGESVVFKDSGTIVHDTSHGKLQLYSNFSDFHGTIRNTSPRWIEFLSKADGTVQSTSATALYDAGPATVPGTTTSRNQGLAFIARSANTLSTFELGGVIGYANLTSSSASADGASIHLKVGTDGQTLISDEENIYYGSIVEAGNKKLSLEKVGDNQWTIAGKQIFTGGTTVSEGTLKMASGSSLASDIVVAEAGTLILQGSVPNLDVSGRFVVDFSNQTESFTGEVMGNLYWDENAELAILLDEILHRDVTYTLNWETTSGLAFSELYSTGVAQGRIQDIWQYSLTPTGVTLSLDPAKVPEPATWVLLLAGFLGYVGFRKRFSTSFLTKTFLLGTLFLPAYGMAQTPENGITAHRGDSLDFPENSLPAFRSAIALGADWVETDVYLTADKKLVLIHDPTTKRYCSVEKKVTDSTYAELCQLDLAEKFRQRHGLTLENCPVQKIVLLEEAIDLILQHRKARLSIQPKCDCVDEVIALIREKKAQKWVGFNDGNARFMARVKELEPEIPVFWDRCRSDIEKDLIFAKEHGFETLVLHYQDVTAEKAAQIEKAGFQVGAWTVNDPPKMEQLLDMGVTRIYTDVPKTLREILEERKGR
ncbi:MAG: glycerophosphodiester phosphodiesterase family protein [Planctomycetia bacterium]|nr:glycerophosphodiester phosphodiesterase family protein [Planctomycetia bacterium]